MASSRKPPTSSSLAAHVAAQLRQYVQPGDRVVAALSGGIDSVVLFDALTQVRADVGIKLSAVHVNHQINPKASSWATFCRALCRARDVPLKVAKVEVARGNSLEAAARDARYAVFAQQRADWIALAHNLDDQAETVLLQLLRGAGIKGLSAMPIMRIQANSDGIKSPSLLRPLLDTPRNEIAAYASERALQWIEDDSNDDVHYNRNFMRHQLLPLIAQRYPAYRRTLSRAAGHFAEAAQLLAELADGDHVNTADNLSIATLRQLPVARAKNAIRHFLAAHNIAMPSAVRLDECVRQITHAADDAQIAITLGMHELRCHRDALYVIERLALPPDDSCWTWQGGRVMRLPELHGELIFSKRIGNGISIAMLEGHQITVRLRRGGERMQPDAKRPRRSLKNLLQEADVAPWLRSGMPLLFADDTLIYAPGIGIDAAFQAAPKERAVMPEWRRKP